MSTTIPFWARISCTVEEACGLTGLGRTTIYLKIRTHELKTAKVGRRTLVIIDSLMALVNACGAPGTTPDREVRYD